MTYPVTENFKEWWEDAVKDRDRYREAIRAAMNELGVPGDGYPAPVANAYDILAAALGDAA